MRSLPPGAPAAKLQKDGIWGPDHFCHSLLIVLHTVLFTSHGFLPACREEEASSKALSMLCHFLLGSNTKMRGCHLPSSLLTCCSCCFVGISSSLRLCVHFPGCIQAHRLPSLRFAFLWCLVIFLPCFPPLHNGRWQPLGKDSNHCSFSCLGCLYIATDRESMLLLTFSCWPHDNNNIPISSQTPVQEIRYWGTRSLHCLPHTLRRHCLPPQHGCKAYTS